MSQDMSRRLFLAGMASFGASALAGCQTTGTSIPAIGTPYVRTVKIAGFARRKGGQFGIIRPQNGRTYVLELSSAELAGQFKAAAADLGYKGELPPAMDGELLDLLVYMADRLGARTVRANSLYRCQAHQMRLYRRGKTGAREGYHPRGQACDLVIPGVSNRRLLAVAEDVGVGRGYYGSFVHVDTGPSRRFR